MSMSLCNAGNVEGGFKAGEKNGVVDGVKACSEVEEGENTELARVGGQAGCVGT